MSSGGKREGAGRKHSPPELKKIPIGLKLPRWLVEWMRARPESQSVLIEDALMKEHNLTPPQVNTKEATYPVVDALNQIKRTKNK